MGTEQAGSNIIDNLLASIDQFVATDGIRLSRSEVLDWWFEDGLISLDEYRAVRVRLDGAPVAA